MTKQITLQYTETPVETSVEKLKRLIEEKGDKELLEAFNQMEEDKFYQNLANSEEYND